jgi:hypothetical protein
MKRNLFNLVMISSAAALSAQQAMAYTPCAGNLMDIGGLAGDATLGNAELCANIEQAISNSSTVYSSSMNLFLNGSGMWGGFDEATLGTLAKGFGDAGNLNTNDMVTDTLAGKIRAAWYNSWATMNAVNNSTYGLSALQTQGQGTQDILNNSTYGLSALRSILTDGNYGLAEIKNREVLMYNGLFNPGGTDDMVRKTNSALGTTKTSYGSVADVVDEILKQVNKFNSTGVSAALPGSVIGNASTFNGATSAQVGRMPASVTRSTDAGSVTPQSCSVGQIFVSQSRFSPTQGRQLYGSCVSR